MHDAECAGVPAPAPQPAPATRGRIVATAPAAASRRHRLALAALAAALAGASLTAGAQPQPFPVKPIRIIVPFAAGGGNDVTARLVAPGMQEALGQPVLVENRPGASGMIGTEFVVKSAPDGYTLMMGSNSTLSIVPALFPNVPYHPVKDLTAITNIQTSPFMLLVRSNFPAQTVAELLKAAREKPGVLTMGSGGTGSSSHLVGELFQMQAGVKLLHVPYKGSGPATADLIGGQIDMRFDQGSTAVSTLKSGKVRGLAVSARSRLAAAPDVPTFAEAGIKDFDIPNLTGLVGPAGMSDAIVSRIHAAVLKALAQPVVRERFAGMGVDIVGSTPAEFAALIKEDFARWTRVVQATGVKPDQ
jgi:tripartite-type tricarboxylate transporter receptor subunit TctC